MQEYHHTHWLTEVTSRSIISKCRSSNKFVNQFKLISNGGSIRQSSCIISISHNKYLLIETLSNLARDCTFYFNFKYRLRCLQICSKFYTECNKICSNILTLAMNWYYTIDLVIDKQHWSFRIVWFIGFTIDYHNRSLKSSKFVVSSVILQQLCFLGTHPVICNLAVYIVLSSFVISL